MIYIQKHTKISASFWATIQYILYIFLYTHVSLKLKLKHGPVSSRFTK